jgi:hypothetical protein
MEKYNITNRNFANIDNTRLIFSQCLKGKLEVLYKWGCPCKWIHLCTELKQQTKTS